MARLIQEFDVGKDFTEGEFNHWREQLTWWISTSMTNVEDPLGHANKVLDAATKGTKLNGEAWPQISNDFFKRVNQLAGFDLKKGVGKKKNPAGRPKTTRNKRTFSQITAEQVPPIPITEVDRRQDAYIENLVAKYPHLDSPVYAPKVTELAELIIKSGMMSLDFMAATGKTLELLTKVRAEMQKQIDAIMNFLEISPKMLLTKQKEAQNSDVGSLIASMEEFGDWWQDFERIDALRELLQKYHQLNALRPDSTPQLNAWELWHMTRNRPVEFTCRCLQGDQKVCLEDGTWVPIKKIVQNSSSERVISLDPLTGKFEARPILSWYTSRTDKVKWFKVSYEGARGRKNNKTESVIVSNDHKIYTRTGLCRADQLTTENEIVVRAPAPNEQQYQVLVGTLLGDASIRSGFCFKHSAKQKEWFDLKVASFKGLRGVVQSFPERNTSKAGFSFRTLQYPFVRKLRNEWYPNGKKVIPEFLDLTPMVLATWYMDDGSLVNKQTVRIATHSFKQDNLVLILEQLLRRYAITAQFNSAGQGCNTKVLAITNKTSNKQVTHDSAGRFFNLISAYIPESMQYKLPEQFRGNYDASLWQLGSANEYSYCKAVVEPCEVDDRRMYCFEVEANHNFVTSANIVVENCGESYTLLGGFTPEEIEQALVQAQAVYGFGLEGIEGVDFVDDGVVREGATLGNITVTEEDIMPAEMEDLDAEEDATSTSSDGAST
ncbi:MAG: hypothetical protein KOO63_08055 [Bacteroidales bacterium]|nr:hypothetical protein [Candidatus Latescibacterota bacterium]